MKMQWQKGLAVLALVALCATGVYAASFYSDQITNEIATPQVKNNANTFGTVYRKYWSFTTVAGSQPVISDVISLVLIPGNSRILGGYVSSSAMGSATAMNIGYPGSLTRYGNTLTINVVSVAYSIASNAFTGFGEVLTKDQTIQLQIAGGTWNAGQTISGWFEFLQ